MEPEHLWAIGEYSDVISSLADRGSVIPVENIQRWRSWEERFAAEVGEAHLETLAAQVAVAFWTGETGDAREAVRLSRELLPDLERVLGPDHPDTLAARGDIAMFTGQGGDVREAVRLCRELLPDQERVLGPDHLDTLRTRERIEALSDRA
jgi:Tetratricopeptide repeat